MIISTLPNGQVYADDISLIEDKDIIITRVQTGAVGSASAEAVEVYNNSTNDIDVSGWCVSYSAGANGSVFTSKGCVDTSDSVKTWLAQGTYMSFATLVYESFYSIKGDFLLSSGLAAPSGHIRISGNDGREIDKVGWGVQGGTSGTSAEFNTIYRVFTESGFQNTFNNKDDFYLGTATDLNQPSGVYELEIDECTNLPGSQGAIPDGYIVDSNGLCVEIEQEEPPIEDPGDGTEPPDSPGVYIPACDGVVITEVLPNPAGADAGKEYIELWNAGQGEVNIKGCSLQTSGNNRVFTFEHDEILLPNEFRAYYDSYTSLTLPNSAGGTVWFLSPESEVSTTTYAAGLADDVAWAQFVDGWFPTFVPTPGQANVYAALKPCAEGYERNVDTNRCGLIITVANSLTPCGPGQERNSETNRCRNVLTSTGSLTPCREGQYRNPETNRCRNIESASALVPCREGQERNPETNRCRNITSSSELADCGEGRERNPETNRCRNVLAAATTTEPYAISNTGTPSGTKTGWMVAGIIFAVAAGYGAYEWRHELGKFARRIVPGKK